MLDFDNPLDAVDGTVASLGGLGLWDLLVHGGEAVFVLLQWAAQLSPVVLPLGALSGRLEWLPGDLVNVLVTAVLAASVTVSLANLIRRRLDT